jgi:hypothetical protein
MLKTPARLCLILLRWLLMVVQRVSKRPSWPQDIQRLMRRNLWNHKNNKECRYPAVKTIWIINRKHWHTIGFIRIWIIANLKSISNNQLRKSPNNYRKENPDKRLFRQNMGLTNKQNSNFLGISWFLNILDTELKVSIKRLFAIIR